MINLINLGAPCLLMTAHTPVGVSRLMSKQAPAMDHFPILALRAWHSGSPASMTTPASEPTAPACLTSEVAKLLRVSTKTVFCLAADDPFMPALGIARTLRFPAERLEKWLRDREQGPARARRIQNQERSICCPRTDGDRAYGSAL
jgi:hypothetical protein